MQYSFFKEVIKTANGETNQYVTTRSTNEFGETNRNVTNIQGNLSKRFL